MKPLFSVMQLFVLYLGHIFVIIIGT